LVELDTSFGPTNLGQLLWILIFSPGKSHKVKRCQWTGNHGTDGENHTKTSVIVAVRHVLLTTGNMHNYFNNNKQKQTPLMA